MKLLVSVFLRVCCYVLIVMANTARAQSTGAPSIVITGDGLKEMTLTAQDLRRLPQVALKAKGHDSREHEYAGVEIYEILKLAGAPLGPKLRGGNLAMYVLITAADNYQVVYALPELDHEFTPDVVLLATAEDGKPLPDGDGPFRLVNPADRKHARWVRQVSRIEIRKVQDH